MVTLHLLYGAKTPIEEWQLHAVVYATAVWHGVDLFQSPLSFELHALATALAGEFKAQVFVMSEGRHEKKPRVLTVADWKTKLASFFRCQHNDACLLSLISLSPSCKYAQELETWQLPRSIPKSPGMECHPHSICACGFWSQHTSASLHKDRSK